MKVKNLTSDEESWSKYFSTRPWPLTEFHWKESEILDFLKQKDQKSLGLIHAEQLCAFILFSETADVAEILYLETHPDFLRNGHMQELLKAFKNQQHSKELWLDVHEKNQAAIAMYGGQGFKKVGERPSYYSDGGAAILMSLPAQIK